MTALSKTSICSNYALFLHPITLISLLIPNTAMDAKVFGMLLKPVLLRFRITQDFCTKDLTWKNVMLNMGENIFLAMSSNTQTHAYGLQFF